LSQHGADIVTDYDRFERVDGLEVIRYDE